MNEDVTKMYHHVMTSVNTPKQGVVTQFPF